MPIWTRRKPALVWMFGEWDEEAALAPVSPDELTGISGPESTDSL
jgi:hypothetical protein